MNKLIQLAVAIAIASGATHAQALALGPDEFAAASNLTCVLAQESLGYLSSEEYGELTRDVLDGYAEAESDVIYAKALGYFDGLMFGLPDDDKQMVDERLIEYVQSNVCSRYTGFEGVKFTL